MKNKQIIPLLTATASGIMLVGCKESKNIERPNFIIIQADDLGFSDLSYNGNKLAETPNLDSMAKQSVVFSQFHVNPVCAPTRASLLTGRFFLRTGVSHVHGGKDFINLSEKLLPAYLKEAGYATGMWGKWHSGTTKGYLPWERGFDEAYKAQLYKHRESMGQLNGRDTSFTQWADEVIVNFAINFIRRNKEQPFFAYLSHLTCHEPLDAYIQKYMDKGLSKNLSTIYAMNDFMDHQLGRLFQFLKDEGLEEKTIVMFMSDNGPAVLNRWLTDEDRAIRYVNNLKGHKGNIWENGVKSPLFVKWTGHIKAGTVQQVADITDILPTLLDLAGIQEPGNPYPVDGISLKEYLIHPGKEETDRYTFNYANPGWPPTDKPWTPEGVMDEYRPLTKEMKDTLEPLHQIISITGNNFKLMFNPAHYQNTSNVTNGKVLINMDEDPTENLNVYNENPDIASELESKLQTWFQEIAAEDNSYQMPLFFIDDDENTIPAKAPVEISDNLKNTYNYLSNWKIKGSFARYRVQVGNPGNYQVQLVGTGFGESPFKMSVFGQTDTVAMIFSADELASEGFIELTEQDTIITLELLESILKEEVKGGRLDEIILVGMGLGNTTSNKQRATSNK